jgi:hypothetical protein
MATQRKTSDKAASAASKVLRDGRTGKDSKIAAASALSQAAPKKPAPKKPLENAPSKKEGAKSGGKRGNSPSKKK